MSKSTASSTPRRPRPLSRTSPLLPGAEPLRHRPSPVSLRDCFAGSPGHSSGPAPRRMHPWQPRQPGQPRIRRAAKAPGKDREAAARRMVPQPAAAGGQEPEADAVGAAGVVTASVDQVPVPETTGAYGSRVRAPAGKNNPGDRGVAMVGDGVLMRTMAADRKKPARVATAANARPVQGPAPARSRISNPEANSAVPAARRKNCRSPPRATARVQREKSPSPTAVHRNPGKRPPA